MARFGGEIWIVVGSLDVSSVFFDFEDLRKREVVLMKVEVVYSL